MKPSLRILHLEDNALDAELVASALGSAGIACDITRVQDRDEFTRALEEGGFDLILADYSLPSFDGASALPLAREKCPDIPYVFVSGTLGEEVAVESLKLGAADYVLKDRLSRLAPAVRRALVEAEERRARKQVEESLKKLNRVYAVLSSVNHLIIRAVDRQELFDGACRILVEEGLFRLAWIGLVDEAARKVKPVASMGCEEGYLGKVNVSIDEVPEGNGPTGLAVRKGRHFINNDTENNHAMLPWRDAAMVRGYLSSASFPLMSDGRAVGAITVYAPEAGFFDEDEVRLLDGMAADISFALKAMEQEELRGRAEARARELGERLHALVEESPAGAFIIQDGRIVFANPAGYSMFGHEEGSTPGISELVHPDDLGRASELYAMMINGEVERDRIEFRCLRKDGSVFDAEVFGFSSAFQGRPAVIGTIIDITERKRTEEALKASEEQFRTLADAIPQLCWTANADGWITWYNQRWYDYTGTTPEQMEGWGWQSVHDPEALPAVLERWKGSIATGSPFDMVFPLRGADGVFRPFLTRVMPMRDQDGKVVRWFGTNTDISEQKRAEEKLVRAKEEWERTFNSVPDMIAILDSQHRIVRVNEAMARRLGMSPEQCVGLPCYEYVHGLPAPPDFCPHTCTIRDGQQHVQEVHEDRLGGDFLVSTTPLLDENGQMTGSVHVAHDITARKRAEVERETVAEFLRIVNESRGSDELIRRAAKFFQSRTGCEAAGIRLKDQDDYPYYEARGFPAEFVEMENYLCALDKDGHPILDRGGNAVLECMCGNVICGRFDPSKAFFTARGSFWTNSATELLASTTEEDRQEHTRNRCQGEGYESVALVALRLGEERLGLIQFNDREKGRFTPEILSMWERLADYMAVALTKFRADEGLLEAYEQRRLALESAGLGAWEYNFERGDVFWDERCRDMFGVAAGGQIDYHEAIRRIHPDDRTATDEAVKEAIAGADNGAYHREFRVLWPDGSVHWVSSHGRVHFEGEGDGRKAVRFVGVNQDITEQKQLEQQRQDFYAMVTHDLKSPLTTILGYSELILSRGGELGKEVREFTAGIEQSGEKLLRMVEDFLAVSRLESGVISLNKAQTDIARLVAEGCRFFEVQVIKKDLDLKCEAGKEPIEALIDGRFVEMALSNLIQNAVNYTPRGGSIRVNAKKVPDGPDGREYLVISVMDSGHGISPGEKDRVFEKYHRLPGSGIKGSGLGLAIVKAVAEAHNGRVELESEPGKGSTFRLVLPV